MNKKIITLSMLVGTLLTADNIKIKIPMPSSVLSVENSGQLSAIDAYGDAVGIYVVEELGNSKITNNEMNSLVFKYGAMAKDSNLTIKEFVSANGTESEKKINIGKFESFNIEDGQACNDNNSNTSNNVYVNGVCVGIDLNTSKVSCNDHLKSGNSVGNGFYTINPSGSRNIMVYCDMITDGGGWTQVVQQYERSISPWTGGGDPNTSGQGYTVREIDLPPDRTQVAFGKDLDPTYIDYANFVYTTDNINKALLNGIKTGNKYHIHRSKTSYYGSHDPDSSKGNTSNWNNTLTFDKIGGTYYNWSFSLNNPTYTHRGYSMNGSVMYLEDTYAWTVWVR